MVVVNFTTAVLNLGSRDESEGSWAECRVNIPVSSSCLWWSIIKLLSVLSASVDHWNNVHLWQTSLCCCWSRPPQGAFNRAGKIVIIWPLQACKDDPHQTQRGRDLSHRWTCSPLCVMRGHEGWESLLYHKLYKKLNFGVDSLHQLPKDSTDSGLAGFFLIQAVFMSSFTLVLFLHQHVRMSAVSVYLASYQSIRNANLTPTVQSDFAAGCSLLVFY